LCTSDTPSTNRAARAVELERREPAERNIFVFGEIRRVCLKQQHVLLDERAGAAANALVSGGCVKSIGASPR
jgi:hypothetical protein